jgi:hypothetical protein
MLTPCGDFFSFPGTLPGIKNVYVKSVQTKPFELASRSTDAQQSKEEDYALFLTFFMILLAPEFRE